MLIILHLSSTTIYVLIYFSISRNLDSKRATCAPTSFYILMWKFIYKPMQTFVLYVSCFFKCILGNSSQLIVGKDSTLNVSLHRRGESKDLNLPYKDIFGCKRVVRILFNISVVICSGGGI